MPQNEYAQSSPTSRQHAGQMPDWARVVVCIQRARLDNEVRIPAGNYLGYLARRNRIRPRFQKDADTQVKSGGPGSKPVSVDLAPSTRFARLVAKIFCTTPGR